MPKKPGRKDTRVYYETRDLLICQWMLAAPSWWSARCVVPGCGRVFHSYDYAPSTINGTTSGAEVAHRNNPLEPVGYTCPEHTAEIESQGTPPQDA